MSQAASITLAVDYANNSTTTDEIYSRNEEYLHRTVYTGPTHTLSDKDTCTMYRTKPKQSGNFKGVAKSTIKFSRDVSVEGVDDTTNVAAVELGEVSFSIPVGTTAADAMKLRQRIIAALDDDTIMVKLMEQLDI